MDEKQILNLATEECGVAVTLSKIGGKWKPLILWYLIQYDVKRYGEIRRFIPSVTNKMLSQQLKELINDGLIHRKDYQTIPPKVEYRITKKGMTLQKVIDDMCSWGLDHMND